MSIEKRCQAITGDGTQCKNEAVYPEDNPVACHIPAHRRQMIEEGEIDMPEKKDEIPEVKQHVFSSTALNHTLFVRYPNDDDRDYFRVVFVGGKYSTNDDEKAELLEKAIENNTRLSAKITKVQ